jgi:hypothetical protein
MEIFDQRKVRRTFDLTEVLPGSVKAIKPRSRMALAKGNLFKWNVWLVPANFAFVMTKIALEVQGKSTTLLC